MRSYFDGGEASILPCNGDALTCDKATQQTVVRETRRFFAFKGDTENELLYFIPRPFEGIDSNRYGFITSPKESSVKGIASGYRWCIDNQVFTGKFNEESFFRFLNRRIKYLSTCVFVNAPDVMYNAVATLDRFSEYAPRIKALGYPVALVAQDGMEKLPLPNDFDAIFIGGSDKWKVGSGAQYLIRQAQERGKWTHMGRVNSRGRITLCRLLGVNSVDGTHPIYEPKEAIKRIDTWMRQPILI